MNITANGRSVTVNEINLINKTVTFTDEHDSMSARQQDSEETSQYADIPAAPLTDKKVKATYYLDPLLVKKLKFLAVEKNKDLSALVGEAIQDLLAKAER